MRAEFSDEEFVGYTFSGSPERRPRLWFLDRHLGVLLGGMGWTVGDTDVGTWIATSAEATAYPLGIYYRLPGVCLNYQHHSEPVWTAVWRLTDLTIPRDPKDAQRGFGVTTFGRDDDVWRLGLWPD